MDVNKSDEKRWIEYIVCYSMCQPLKRNPTREKKPPKHLLYDDTEYLMGSIKIEQKATSKPKEAVSTPSETTAIAVLLTKFISCTNQKLQEVAQRMQQELATEEKEKTERTQPGYEDGTTKKVKLDRNLPGSHSGLASSLEKLLDGSANRLQTERGKELKSIRGKTDAKEGRKRGKYGPRSKSPKKKEESGDPKSGKPFKRQSYHVAVAYRVYMHLHQTGQRPNADPTLFARQLKQQTQLH